MYSASNNSDHGLSFNATSYANLPVFPSEDPTKKELEDWLDSASTALLRAGYGPAMRNEDPPSLIPLTLQVGVPDPTPLSAAEKAAAGPLEALRHEKLCEKTTLDKQSAKLTLEMHRREYHNKLAAILDAAMRRSAGLRLRTLMNAHKDPNHADCYDGGAMWRELDALRSTASRLEDVRRHDRAVEAARDTFLPNGCSANAYMDKVNGLVRDHIPYLERPMEGAALGRFLIGIMPKANAAEGRGLIRELNTPGATHGLDDCSYVIKRCAEIVRESTTSTDDSTTELSAYFANDQKRAAFFDVLRAQGASAAFIQNMTAAAPKSGRNDMGPRRAARATRIKIRSLPLGFPKASSARRARTILNTTSSRPASRASGTQSSLDPFLNAIGPVRTSFGELKRPVRRTRSRWASPTGRLTIQRI